MRQNQTVTVEHYALRVNITVLHCSIEHFLQIRLTVNLQQAVPRRNTVLHFRSIHHCTVLLCTTTHHWRESRSRGMKHGVWKKILKNRPKNATKKNNSEEQRMICAHAGPTAECRLLYFSRAEVD
jgi:hypothetical protein